MTETWTVLRVLDWTTGHFDRAGLDSPRLEAQVLLAHVLSCDRVGLYTSFDKPLAEPELRAYRELIRRRLAGEPVAYLIGRQEFWSRDFRVDHRVLIPRRDTETLIEAVLDRVDAGAELSIADIATGSGAIGLTLAAELPRAMVVLTDISAAALELTRDNAARLGVVERVEIVEGDLCAPLTERRFDVVVSNPPYVADGDYPGLSAEVRSEPRAALVSGVDGLDHLRQLCRELPAVVAPGGLVVLEHGFDQGPAVRKLLGDAGFTGPATVPDLAGRDRISLARST